MWRFMSEFVFWDSDMERFSVCESDSQVNTLHPLQGQVYGGGGGGGAYKGLLGTQVCGLIFGAFLCSEFYGS